jgi:hypothetical protein
MLLCIEQEHCVCEHHCKDTLLLAPPLHGAAAAAAAQLQIK